MDRMIVIPLTLTLLHPCFTGPAIGGMKKGEPSSVGRLCRNVIPRFVPNPAREPGDPSRAPQAGLGTTLRTGFLLPLPDFSRTSFAGVEMTNETEKPTVTQPPEGEGAVPGRLGNKRGRGVLE